MSRPLPVLVVIAAASLTAVWIQAATRGATERIHAPAEIGRVEVISSVAIANPAAPAADAKSPAKPMTARAAGRRTIASRGAEPLPATAPEANQRLRADMKVAMDPLTGQIIAPEHSGTVLTLEEMQNLARREAEGLFTIRNPDGSETLNHEGRFVDHTVARMGPDGKLLFKCVHGEFGVEHALRHATRVTSNTEDR